MMETNALKSKVEQLCEKMEAVVGMWWMLDGDKLKVAVTVTKQPRLPARPDAFVEESCKKQFQPGDTSAVSRVFTSKQQIWMPLAKNDMSYQRKDLAAQFNISSIGLIHMDGGVFEYAFEKPRANPPILYVSGEPLEEGDRAYEAEEGAIRWSQKKNSVLLSPAERKRRRLESNRAAAKRAYYRRLNKSDTMQQENDHLRGQLNEERSKVAVYESLLQRLGVHPAGALAAIKGIEQANALAAAASAFAAAPRTQQLETRDPAHAVQSAIAVPSAATATTTQLLAQHPTLATSASSPALLGSAVPTVLETAPSLQLQQQDSQHTDAANTRNFNCQHPDTSTAAPGLGLSSETDRAMVQTIKQNVVATQTDVQRKLAELQKKQEQELMSLEQQHRQQLSGVALNVSSTADTNFTAAGPPLSNLLWTEDVNALSSDSQDDYLDEYSSAPE